MLKEALQRQCLLDAVVGGGGKGPLIQDDKSATLSTLNIQTLFQPVAIENHPADSRVKLDESGTVQTLTTRMGTGGGNVPMLAVPDTKVYGICSYASNSMKSDNPHSGIYEAETTRTLDQNGGSPACNQGGMAIVQGYDAYQHHNWRESDKLGPMTTGVGRVRGDTPLVGTYQKITGPLMANSHPGSYTGQDAHSDMLVSQRYSVRRLTPLECERLQGFPDGWTDIPGQTEATQEELEFWRDVWVTWDKVQAEHPEKVRPRRDNALLKWLKNPVSDSAQYKALGNSVAVPCPEYVLEGISEVFSTER